MCYSRITHFFYFNNEKEKENEKLLLVIMFSVTSILLLSCKKDDKIQIGILQYVSHSALNDAKEGFIEGLAEKRFIDVKNVTITVQNAEADATTMQSQVKSLV